jgi:hypothetical protein
MNWTLAGDGLSADFFDDSLNAGWYTIEFRLFDDGTPAPSAGFATLARIVQDQVTSGQIDLDPNAVAGQMELIMDTDFYEVLDVTVDQPEDTYYLSSTNSMTINASAAGTVLWAWYKQGELIDTASSFTIDGSTLTDGNTYRYDLLSLSSDGKSGWSGTWIIEAGEPDATVNWSPAAGYTYQLTLWDVNADTAYLETEWFDETVTEYIVGELPDGDYKFHIGEDTDGNGVMNNTEWFENVSGESSATIFNVPADLPINIDFGPID